MILIYYITNFGFRQLNFHLAKVTRVRVRSMVLGLDRRCGVDIGDQG